MKMVDHNLLLPPTLNVFIILLNQLHIGEASLILDSMKHQIWTDSVFQEFLNS